MAADQEGAFEQSGIHFPGGFDLNTVGDLSGKATGLSRPVGNGPVILNIETAWEKYAVVTCPPWYWDELKIKVSVGEEIRVIGSKSLGKDGQSLCHRPGNTLRRTGKNNHAEKQNRYPALEWAPWQDRFTARLR